jgi:hypothetical protein
VKDVCSPIGFCNLWPDEIDDEGQNDALVNLSTMWRRRWRNQYKLSI